METTVGYFELTDDIYADYRVQGCVTPKLDISFLAGEQIKMNIPRLTFEVNYPSGHSLPHFLGDEFPLVSKAFVDL